MTEAERLARQQEAADSYHRLALELEAAGLTEAALIGFQAAASLDLLNPVLQQSFGGPFNGQERRREIFKGILAHLLPGAVVETGTYRGTTTEYIAGIFSGPIFSCEVDTRCFLASRRKLARFAHVEIAQCDSRRFLREALDKLPPGAPILIYLDAHWGADLPLREEIEIVLTFGRDAAIMIDDFEVPFDQGYGFDDYGAGGRLSLALLEFVKDRSIRLFFPSTASERETGARRGSVVLATSPRVAAALAEVGGLVGGDWHDWHTG